jgi:anaphase-promoting complex subunit 1
VVLEGALVNLDVTSLGATLGLGLMFLKTNDAAMAASCAILDTHFALDYGRPDMTLSTFG